MDAIITAATIFTMYFNLANATIAGGDFYYNADVQDNKVCTMCVYNENADKMLSSKIKYDFTYDAKNRLVSREAYKWNSETNEWNNYYLINFSYEYDRYDIVLNMWNSKTNAYDMVKEKYVYGVKNNYVTSVHKYKWNDKNREFDFIDHHLSIDNDKPVLMADIFPEI